MVTTTTQNPTLPRVRVRAVCHDCRRQHTYEVLPRDLSVAMGEWLTKHHGHPVEFSTPKPLYTNRWSKWLQEFWSECPLWAPADYAYGHNADHKLAYAASAAYTISLASLATSSTLVAGRESDAVSNASNKYLDYLIAGKVRVGTTPTASTLIQAWVYAALNDTPTYPDVFDGTDSAETVTSAGIRDSALKIAPQAVMLVDATTSDRDYFCAPFSLAQLHGFQVPTHHGLFVTHSTAVNLNATGGNHVLNYTPLYGTIA
jgi:hypothetical protein